MTTRTRISGAACTARPVIADAWRRCCLDASLPFLATSGDVHDLLGAAANAPEATLVVLVDGARGASGAVEALRRANAIILLLTPAGLSRSDRASLRAGVDGMVTLDDPLSALADALTRLTDGDAYVSSSAARLLLDDHRLQLDDQPGGGAVVLSGRERTVLQAMVDGLTTKATARQLGISTKTVEAHRSRLYARLGVRSQSQAVARALTDTRLLS